MLLQPRPPIVVDVVKQPPVAPEITMGDVVLGAIGLTGVIMICALAAGLLVGGVFIWIKRMRDASAPPTDPGHSRLRT
jgi:hypothetical protein